MTLAIALLHIAPSRFRQRADRHVVDLDDCVLVHTGIRYDDEGRATALRAMLGEAAAQHHDARGIFLIPDVVEPVARDYESVIEEVGVTGEWVTPTSAVPPAIERTWAETQKLLAIAKTQAERSREVLGRELGGLGDAARDLGRKLESELPKELGKLDLDGTARKLREAAEETLAKAPELRRKIEEQIRKNTRKRDDPE